MKKVVPKMARRRGSGGDGGATRPLSRVGSAEKFFGDPTVGPHPRVWTRGQKWKK